MKTRTHRLIKTLLNIKWRIIDSLAYHLGPVNSWYITKIGADYEKEYHEFNITQKNHVLHIGCGSYPMTEYIIAEKIGATITGVDNNKKALQKAKKHHQKHYPSLTTITFEHHEGKNIDPKGYDVIILSSCTNPMIDVFKNITKKSKKGTTIILRELDSCLLEIDHYIATHPELKEQKRIRHNSGTTMKSQRWQSLFLKKMS